MTANATQATAQLTALDRQLKGTAATAKTTSAGMGAAMAKGAKFGGLAIAGLGAISVKAAVDFESSFAEVRKTVDTSEKGFKRLETSLRDLAKEIPVSVNELNDLAGQAGALGIKAKDLVKFTKTAAELGVTTDLSANDAANALARLSNIMGTSSKDFRRLGSTFVELGNKGASTEAEIAAMSLRLASAGRQVGLTESEVLSFSSALASVGIEAEAGGSAFSRAFIEMSKAVDAGAGDLDQFAQIAGISSGKFATLFGQDAAGAMVLFTQGLERMRKEGESSFDMLENLSLGDIRVGNALRAASTSGDLFNKTLAVGTKEWEKNSALTEEANKRYATTAAKWQVMKNKANDLFISIGQDLLPELNEMMDILSNPKLTLDEKVAALGDKLSDAIKEWAPKVAAAGFKLGTALAKGIWDAFWNGDLLTKIFIGAGLLRIFGGKAAIIAAGTRLGGLMGTPWGAALSAALLAAYAGVESKLGEKVAALASSPFSEWLRDEAENMPIAEVEEKLEIAAAAGQAFSRDMIRSWRLAGDVSEEGARRMIRALGNTERETRKMAAQTGPLFRGVSQSARESFAGAGAAVRDFGEQVDGSTGRVRDDLGKLKPIFSDVEQSAREKFAGAGDASRELNRRVSGNMGSIAGATLGALQNLGKNVAEAMRAFNGPKLSFGWSTLDGQEKAKFYAHGGIVGAQKGAIVPGSGSGDTVPLHIGGRLAAMVEPRELVSVANRTATAALMGVNAKVPRRAEGGPVGGGMSAMIAEANRFEAESFPYVWGGGHGGFGIQPVDCSGAVSDVLHAAGLLSAPMVSGALMNWGQEGTGPLTVYASPGHTVMSLAGKFFGTSGSNPGGGAGWIEGGSPALVPGGVARTMDVAGAVASEIKRVLLSGPDGPLKDMGQGALDKARNAANKFIAASMPTGTFGGGDANVDLGGGTVKGRATWFTGGTMASGLNTDINPGIALNPNAGGPDPSSWNNPTTQAWLAARQKFLVDIGGKSAVLPVLDMGPAGWTGNAIDVNLAGLGSMGYSTSTFPSGTVGTASMVGKMLGGLVPGFGEGGVLPGIPFDLVSELKRIAASANRTEIFGDLMGKVNAIADLEGFGSSGQLQGDLKTLREDADRFGQNASLAAQLTITEDFGDPDNPDDDIAATLGVFQGLNEFDWLTKQLGNLFELRNRIVGAQERIKNWRDSVKKVERVAATQLREYEELVKAAENKLQEKGALPDKWKGPNPLGDIKAWNKLDDKKREKQGKKFLKEGGKLPGSRKFLKNDDMTLVEQRSSPELFPNITGYRAVTASLANTLIPALGEEGSALGEALRTAYSELDSIQGSHQNEFLNHLDAIPADIGSLGGEIFNVRLAMQGFDPTAGAGTPLSNVDTSAADALLALTQQQTANALRDLALSQSQYKVFQDFGAFDSTFAGLFAKGGSIPGGMWGIAGERGAEIVHGPASVYSAADSQQMLGAPPAGDGEITVNLNFADGMGWLREFVDVEVQRHDRQSARVGRVRSYS